MELGLMRKVPETRCCSICGCGNGRHNRLSDCIAALQTRNRTLEDALREVIEAAPAMYDDLETSERYWTAAGIAEKLLEGRG
jgi:hypothetical protein